MNEQNTPQPLVVQESQDKFDAENLRALGLIPAKRRRWALNPFRYLQAYAWDKHWFRAYKVFDWINDVFFRWYNIFWVRTLPKHWSDVTYSLPHVMFHMLTQFVEIEEPFDNIYWDSDDNHSQAAQEILELYSWWKKDPFAKDESAPIAVYPNWSAHMEIDDDESGDECPETLHNYLLRLEHIGREFPKEHFYWKAFEEFKESVKDVDDSEFLDHISQKYNFLWSLEREMNEKRTEMLVRLVKVRGYLWT